MISMTTSTFSALSLDLTPSDSWVCNFRESASYLNVHQCSPWTPMFTNVHLQHHPRRDHYYLFSDSVRVYWASLSCCSRESFSSLCFAHACASSFSVWVSLMSLLCLLLLLWLWFKWNWSKESPFEACQPQDWSWPSLSPKQPDAPHIWRERVNNCFSVFLWILFICSRKSLTWRRFPPSEEPFLQGPQPYDVLFFCPHFDGSDIDNHHSGQNFDYY